MPRSYEVRVKEQISPYKSVKKSKFYYANSPSEAGSRYDGPGRILWVEKVSREKLLGVREFFKLGDTLLKDFSDQLALSNQKTEERIRQRRKNNAKHRERSAHQY